MGRSGSGVLRLLLGTLLPLVSRGFTSSFVELCGVNHHIRDTGEVDPEGQGPIAVLLHGFAGSTESWDEVAPLLAAGVFSP